MDNNGFPDLIAEAALAPLAALVRPVIEGLGYDLVRLARPNVKEETLQIMAEHPDGREISLEDCMHISRAVSAALDEADPIAEPYQLEVSSPGIDRPLTRQKDFVRWTGFEARLETAREIEGRGRFHGRILAVSDTHLTVREDAGTIDLPLDALKRVKLVLNDELLAATKRAA